MAGGKGGTQTTQVQLPKSLERAANENLALADAVGQLGYIPYTGPTVAGLTDPQRASMANTHAAASAFGLATAPTGAIGTPGGPQSPSQAATPSQGTDTAGNPMYGPISANDPNSQGYSPYGLYQQALGNMQQGQMDYLAQFFINPETGERAQFDNPGSRTPLTSASRGGKK